MAEMCSKLVRGVTNKMKAESKRLRCSWARLKVSGVYPGG
jgi:hypothetical protein